MNAGSIGAPLEHQLTIMAPLGQQVGQAPLSRFLSTGMPA
jgi:hypothetical protein